MGQWCRRLGGVVDGDNMHYTIEPHSSDSAPCSSVNRPAEEYGVGSSLKSAEVQVRAGLTLRLNGPGHACKMKL